MDKGKAKELLLRHLQSRKDPSLRVSDKYLDEAISALVSDTKRYFIVIGGGNFGNRRGEFQFGYETNGEYINRRELLGRMEKEFTNLVSPIITNIIEVSGTDYEEFNR